MPKPAFFHYFFKSKEFSKHPKLSPNAEQIVEADTVSLQKLKRLLCDELTNFNKNVPFYEVYFGKKEAESWQKKIENYDGSAMGLVKEILNMVQDVKFLSSVTLRRQLLNGLVNYFAIHPQAVERKVSERLRPALVPMGMGMTYNFGLENQIRYQVQFEMVYSHLQSCELQPIVSRKIP